MVAIYVVVMLAALVGMIVCNKKQNVVAAAKPLAIVLLVVVVGCGIGLLKEMNVFGGEMEAIRENETAFYASQGAVVGEFVKDKLGGGKILVIADTNFKDDTMLPKLVEAFQTASGAEVVVDTVDVKGTEDGAPLMERMKAADFDAAVGKYADAKVVVSLIGLPRDLAKLKMLAAAATTGPKLILFSPSEIPGLDKALESGAVSAVVTTSPKAVFDENKAPKDPKKAFDVRYVLVTKDNVKEYGKQLGL